MKWAKNAKILIFAKLHFSKNKQKHWEISLFYTCIPKILMIWSTLLEIYRVRQIEIGNYGSFCAPLLPPPEKSKKSVFLKNEKNCWRYLHFTHVYQNSQSRSTIPEKWSERQLFVTLGHFLPFYPLTTHKTKNFEKLI